jgi:uncharacterized protein (TIGR02453 family)
MLNPKTYNFLSELAENNNKPWFDENRKIYEGLRKDFIDFLENLLVELKKFDSDMEMILAKKSIFRINRDIRFSNDKSPYKKNFGAYFCKGGKSNLINAGYYIHIEPGKNFIGSGIYQPPVPALKKIRQEIDYNFDAFKDIVLNENFVHTFGDLFQDDKLKRPPKGYDEENEAIEYLKLKSFFVGRNFSDKELTTSGSIKHIGGFLKISYPLIQFLNAAVEEI